MRYRLTDDGDGHWYLIPATKLADFMAAIESFDGYGDLLPAYAKDLGCHPHWVTFEDPKIDE